MQKPLPHSYILEIEPYVAGKSSVKGAGQGEILKLSSNENLNGASAKAVAAARQALESANRYPDSSYAGIRNAIAEIYGLDAARIVCGAGSDELIGLLVSAYAGAGSEVLYSEHGFLMYKIYALANGAKPVTAPEKNLRADIDAILAKVTENTKIVFLATPNNPTGSYTTTQELQRLRSELPQNILLVLDCAYAEYADAVDYTDGLKLVENGDNVCVLRTFSKVYGLSALRLGWGYFPGSVADALNRIRGPFNVSSIAAAAGIEAVRDQAHVQKSVQENAIERDRLTMELAAIGLKAHPSQANFLLVEFGAAGHKNHIAADEFLQSQGIIVRRVDNYGLPGFLRITIGRAQDNDKVLAVLKKFMS